MFGHDDKHQDDNQSAPVVPDTSLGDSGTPDLPDSTPSSDQTTTSAVAPDVTSSTPPVDDNLLGIKRQALQQLQPLVGHLDQTPEEKFKTTMMMIQAADDKTLVQTAYDAAQQISDEKTRAQALLDVINEINYFTHPQDK